MLTFPLERKPSELYSQTHAVTLKYDVSNSDHITLYDWMTVYNKIQRLWKETKILSQLKQTMRRIRIVIVPDSSQYMT